MNSIPHNFKPYFYFITFWHVAEIGMYMVYCCRILTYAVYATNEVVTILNGKCQTIVFLSWHVYDSITKLRGKWRSSITYTL